MAECDTADRGNLSESTGTAPIVAPYYSKREFHLDLHYALAKWVRSNAYWLPDWFVVWQLKLFCAHAATHLQHETPPKPVNTNPFALAPRFREGGFVPLPEKRHGELARTLDGMSDSNLNFMIQKIARMSEYSPAFINALHLPTTQLVIITDSGPKPLSSMTRSEKIRFLLDRHTPE